MRGKKNLKPLWISLLSLGGVLALAGALFGAVELAKNLRENRDPATAENDTGLVQAVGRSLYDADGKLLRLKGVNVGNALVYEGWMSPFSCGAKRDEAGNIVTDKDGNVEYPELTSEDVRSGLLSNPNLSDEERQKLKQAYLDNWFSEEDFARVKELGMNALRLPFYWRDFLIEENGVYSLRPEEEAFPYFDAFLEHCQQQGLYCILDFHGFPKTQNGYEHSGSTSHDMLWDDPKAMDAGVEVWRAIAAHYLDLPLGKAIASYDIMNEPESEWGTETKKDIYPYFDRLYQAIRGTGDKHCITVEAMWTMANFPNPKDYGWENVQYEFHQYNWSRYPYWLFYDYHEIRNWFHDYEVPYYCGEFTLFDDLEQWKETLSFFEKRGYSWTMWSYKKTVVGWWDDTWGLYDLKLYLDNNAHEEKLDLRSASYEDLLALAERTNTSHCEPSSLFETLQEALAA